MTEHESAISVETLRALILLDQTTWTLYWKLRSAEFFASKAKGRGAKSPEALAKTWNQRFAGKKAFAHSSGNGYQHGCLFNRKFYAHRVVYALFHGHWPIGSVDHIDGTRTNNDPANLRDVSHRDNCRNQPLSKANSSGITGVSFDRSRAKYTAAITVNGKTIHLGKFVNLGEAVAARKSAESAYGFHQNHGRRKA